MRLFFSSLGTTMPEVRQDLVPIRPHSSAQGPKYLTRPTLGWGLYHLGVIKDAPGTSGCPSCITEASNYPESSHSCHPTLRQPATCLGKERAGAAKDLPELLLAPLSMPAVEPEGNPG